jgi:hypothetical protein
LGSPIGRGNDEGGAWVGTAGGCDPQPLYKRGLSAAGKVKTGRTNLAQRVHLLADRNLTIESAEDTETPQSNGRENRVHAFLDLDFLSE